jgi:hypothetical protein
MSPTPVPNKSSIVGYIYDYSTGPPVGRRDVAVKLTGCSWDANWSTDDNGYFFFNDLGQGAAYVNVQLPPGGHAINPNVLVQTSGVTETYTVYLGYYLGDTRPSGPFNTPDGKPLSGSTTPTDGLPPGATTGDTLMPSVGGVPPVSDLLLSAGLLMLLPFAGLTRMMRLKRRRVEPG